MLTSAEQTVWNTVLVRIKQTVSVRVFEHWFKTLHIEDLKRSNLGDIKLLLSAPTVSVKHSIQSFYSQQLKAACEAAWPDVTDIQIQVRKLGYKVQWGFAPVMDPTVAEMALTELALEKKEDEELFLSVYVKDPKIEIGTILKTVENKYETTAEEMLEDTRTDNAVFARSVAMWLADALCSKQKLEIAKAFGRTYQSFRIGVERIELLLKNDKKLKRELKDLAISIKSMSGI